MSVYTQLSCQDFAYYCAQFGVAFVKAEPIAQGIKNSNWFITQEGDDRPRFVFTLFEERPVADVLRMTQILEVLDGSVPVARPIKAQESAVILHETKGKARRAITLLPVLDGAHPDAISASMARTIGQALAQIHQTLRGKEALGVSLYDWTSVAARESKKMPQEDKALLANVWAHWEAFEHLPRGLCHLDLFADNTLWVGERLSGILDFTEVAVEAYVFDIAITLNDFCTHFDGDKVDYNETLADALLAGYAQVRALTAKEVDALPCALAYAASIFWLLRLNVIYQNQTQNRTGESISVKDPDLMRRLCAYHAAGLGNA